MLELEDGEQVEMEMGELEGEDEKGEYAPGAGEDGLYGVGFRMGWVTCLGSS